MLSSNSINNGSEKSKSPFMEKAEGNVNKSVEKLKFQFDGAKDTVVWGEFKKGNRDAMVYMYYKYYPILYNYGHQLTSNTQQVEDCIQELFLNLSQSRKNLSDTDSIKFYLIKSFKNLFLKVLKKEAKATENARFFAGYDFQFTLSAEEKMINAQLDEERIEKLNMALSGLTARQREAIYYYFYESMTIDQIAEILVVGNRRTIQNIIYRALAYLRIHIELSVILPYFLIS